MGGRRSWILLVAVTLAVTACNDAAADPTLATGTTAPPTTTPPTTTTSSTTTTAPPPTTTENPDARFQEIQERVQEAVLGRLQAQFDRDAEALLHWVGSQAVYERQIRAFERDDWLQRPSEQNYQVWVDEVLLDRSDCVVTLDSASVSPGVIDGFDGSSTSISIWWPAPEGHFQLGASWQQGTPRSQWIEECDIAVRGVTP